MMKPTLSRFWSAPWREVMLLIACLLAWGTTQATPKIQHWQTANGARVYFVPAPALPMVDVRVVFDAGSVRDDAQQGVAVLTSGLLNEGAGELDAQAISERFENLGARFSAHAERDSAALTLRSLTEAALLDPALATVNLILRDANFPQAAFERERKRLLVALRNEQQNPEAIADRAFYTALYGDHPYSHEPSGSEATVSALKREQVVAFYRRHYVGRNAVIAIVGAVDRAAAERLAETLMAGVEAGEAPPPIPPVSPLTQARQVRLSYPASQSHILIGQPGVKRLDPDYYALYVGNHILGGSGLVSRLVDEIREKRGLSYSAASTFAAMRQTGPFLIGLQTRNASVDEALEVTRNTLLDFYLHGPTAKELNAAKQNITGGFALRLDSNAKIADILAAIGYIGLPLDYLDTYIARINAIPLADIRAAWRRHVQPGRMVTVVVGDTAEAQPVPKRDPKASPVKPTP